MIVLGMKGVKVILEPNIMYWQPNLERETGIDPPKHSLPSRRTLRLQSSPLVERYVAISHLRRALTIVRQPKRIVTGVVPHTVLGLTLRPACGKSP
jgi:hypothetical protein